MIRVLAVQGYFGGVSIRPLEKIPAKPNQRVIITITDEFIEPENAVGNQGMRGAPAQYADPAPAKREAGAWDCAAVEKHDPA